jgi:hypothetical protein
MTLVEGACSTLLSSRAVRSLFIISGEDLVRALVRAGFHLMAAGGGTARLRREAREVEVPLLPFLEESMIESVLVQAGMRPLELVNVLSYIEDETRWRSDHAPASHRHSDAKKKDDFGVSGS